MLDFYFIICQNLPRTAKNRISFSLSGSSFGDIAQLVEQMTFNHWVQGSSPCVPTRNKTTPSGVFLFLRTWDEEPVKAVYGEGSTLSKRAKLLRRRFVRNAPQPVRSRTVRGSPCVPTKFSSP